jgi:hypothetical protein
MMTDINNFSCMTSSILNARAERETNELMRLCDVCHVVSCMLDIDRQHDSLMMLVETYNRLRMAFVIISHLTDIYNQSIYNKLLRHAYSILLACSIRLFIQQRGYRGRL